MRILVISDSHGNYPSILQAEELAGHIDAIIHLGDGANDAILASQALSIEVRYVAGNCDLGASAPRELVWECEGHRLLLAHGDKYSVKYSLEKLKQRSLEVEADIVLYGHTHSAAIDKIENMLFINPGTLIKSSNHKTFAILEINSNCATATLHDIT